MNSGPTAKRDSPALGTSSEDALDGGTQDTHTHIHTHTHKGTHTKTHSTHAHTPDTHTTHTMAGTRRELAPVLAKAAAAAAPALPGLHASLPKSWPTRATGDHGSELGAVTQVSAFVARKCAAPMPSQQRVATAMTVGSGPALPFFWLVKLKRPGAAWCAKKTPLLLMEGLWSSHSLE